MTEILNIILSNLIMVGVFLIPFVLFRVADILFGVAIARKSEISFNWKKFLWGIFYTFCAVIGLACFVTSVSLIIPLIEYYGLILDENVLGVLNSINCIAVCGYIVYVSVMGYGKDAFSKFHTLVEK